MKIAKAALICRISQQDGDLETARVREKRSERPSILKERKKKSHKSESNGEAITFNGDLTHPEKTGEL